MYYKSKSHGYLVVVLKSTTTTVDYFLPQTTSDTFTQLKNDNYSGGVQLREEQRIINSIEYQLIREKKSVFLKEFKKILKVPCGVKIKPEYSTSNYSNIFI